MQTMQTVQNEDLFLNIYLLFLFIYLFLSLFF